MIAQLAITFLCWLVLTYVGINLIGMLIWGFVRAEVAEEELSKVNDSLKEVASKYYNSKFERKTNVGVASLIIIYLGILLYFWNVGVVIIAVMIMFARIPNLLWEIKHGRRKLKEAPPIFTFLALIIYAMLPALWYVIY
jgi:hypothetical protein